MMNNIIKISGPVIFINTKDLKDFKYNGIISDRKSAVFMTSYYDVLPVPTKNQILYYYNEHNAILLDRNYSDWTEKYFKRIERNEKLNNINGKI